MVLLLDITWRRQILLFSITLLLLIGQNMPCGGTYLVSQNVRPCMTYAVAAASGQIKSVTAHARMRGMRSVESWYGHLASALCL